MAKPPGSGKIKPEPPEAKTRNDVYKTSRSLAAKGGGFTKSGKPVGHKEKSSKKAKM